MSILASLTPLTLCLALRTIASNDPQGVQDTRTLQNVPDQEAMCQADSAMETGKALQETGGTHFIISEGKIWVRSTWRAGDLLSQSYA